MKKRTKRKLKKFMRHAITVLNEERHCTIMLVIAITVMVLAKSMG